MPVSSEQWRCQWPRTGNQLGSNHFVCGSSAEYLRGGARGDKTDTANSLADRLRNGQLSPLSPCIWPSPPRASWGDKPRKWNLPSVRDFGKTYRRGLHSTNQKGIGEVPGRTWCLGLLLVLFPESLWTGFRLVPQGRESGCRPWGPFQLAGQSFLSMMKLIFLWLTMQIRSIKLASGPGLSRCAWAVNLSANRSSSDSLIPLGEVTHGGSSGKTRMM